jgi:mannose-1-phosphate guanylyltransferase
MAVVTADHHLDPKLAFREDVSAAIDIAERDGVIATIGIKPTRPESGYGYIERWQSAPIESPARAFAVKRFHEKPSPELAEEYTAREDFLWNSGMFFWTLETFRSELRRVAPTAADITSASQAAKRSPNSRFRSSTVTKAAVLHPAGGARDTYSPWHSVSRPSVDSSASSARAARERCGSAAREAGASSGGPCSAVAAA